MKITHRLNIIKIMIFGTCGQTKSMIPLNDIEKIYLGLMVKSKQLFYYNIFLCLYLTKHKLTCSIFSLVQNSVYILIILYM